MCFMGMGSYVSLMCFLYGVISNYENVEKELVWKIFKIN
jgi:hypothetical protein